MIIFIYGQDTFRSRQKLNEIVKEYQKRSKGGLSLKYFEGEDVSFQDLKEETQQASMFEEKKLLIVRNGCSNTQLKDDFIKGVKDLLSSDDIIVFYEEGNLKKNDRILTLAKKEGKVQEFPLLTGQNLRNWFKKEFNRYKANIDARALDQLIEFVGSDLWQGNLEVKKLVNYKKGKTIEPADVKLLVRPKLDTDIFKTIDAIAKKDRKLAISLIHKHLEKGDQPLYLLTMITYQFRNLLQVKDLMDKGEPYYAILKKTKLHPFVVKKSYQQAQSFSLDELKKIYQRIFEVDLSIKTGKMEPLAALDLFLATVD